MPEWPEMEHYRTMLSRLVAGKRITGVEVQREKSLNVTEAEFRSRILDREIIEVERRAKMLLFHLRGNDTLLLHLMLGGWMFYGSEAEKPNRTIQVRLEFGVQRLYFIGLRLGYLHIYDPQELKDKLAGLGPEPFDPALTNDGFRDLMLRRRCPLKVLLTDQSVLAGIGNCYSDEICYAAKVRPSRKPDSLNPMELKALYESMQNVLREAVNHGGYMMPFTKEDRITGGYDRLCKVYDREGEPCYRCGKPILHEKIASKKTFYCPFCQQ